MKANNTNHVVWNEWILYYCESRSKKVGSIEKKNKNDRSDGIKNSLFLLYTKLKFQLCISVRHHFICWKCTLRYLTLHTQLQSCGWIYAKWCFSLTLCARSIFSSTYFHSFLVSRHQYQWVLFTNKGLSNLIVSSNIGNGIAHCHFNGMIFFSSFYIRYVRP